MGQRGGHVWPEWEAIMTTDIEDLLREGMERFTADLRAPAGLTRDVAHRRRPRLAQRSAAGAAAALAVGAVAAVAVVVPGALRGATGKQAVDTAYVVNRVDSALSAAEPNEIARIAITAQRTAAPAGKTTTISAEEWSYGDQWRSVVNLPTGQPVYDEGAGSSSVYTVVSYLNKEWARQAGLGRPNAALGPALPAFTSLLGRPLAPLFGPPAARASGPAFKPVIRQAKAQRLRSGCTPVIATAPRLFQPGLPGIGLAASSVPGVAFSANSLPIAKALRSAISCGVLTESGRQRVNGIDTIELKSRSSSPISETIWVTPGTYLPVRVVIRSSSGGAVPLQTANITWLAPTAQNLAKLAVPIPAGYRHVSLPEALLTILLHFPGGSPGKLNRLCLAGLGGQGAAQCYQSAKSAK
jgi:hypothetical protein